jgi:hypothetical protein
MTQAQKRVVRKAGKTVTTLAQVVAAGLGPHAGRLSRVGAAWAIGHHMVIRPDATVQSDSDHWAAPLSHSPLSNAGRRVAPGGQAEMSSRARPLLWSGRDLTHYATRQC